MAEAGSRNQRITLIGYSSKARMGGPIAPSDVTISTAALNKVLQYEPSDLTISVGAGMSYCELNSILAEHRQMIPLDPPFSDRAAFAGGATIGGIVAANTCGPRRRLYGSARDMVIGMTFVTLEGKLVKTGGMVVKNVAGLDMGKLMIGSFGTLAAIATLNFRLHPMPAGTRTFVQEFEKVTDVIAARDEVLKSRLQPMAIDIVKSGGRLPTRDSSRRKPRGSGSLLARADPHASAGRRRRRSAVARHSRSDAAISPTTREWRGSACFLRALRRWPRAGVTAGPSLGSRRLGRLLWIFRSG